MRAIDLNADVGEGFGRWTLGDDEALLDVVTSANVACGFHAGDPTIMRRICSQAVERGVRIGAQVGYRDLAGFGRREIDIAQDDLAADVLYQLGALQACAAATGSTVAYLKPHGALQPCGLGRRASGGRRRGRARLRRLSLPVLAFPTPRCCATPRQPDCQLLEAFADRAYRGDGTLVPLRAGCC